MRVLLDALWHGPGAGGAGRYARELTGALLEAGVDVVVVAPSDAPLELTTARWAADVSWMRPRVASSSRQALALRLGGLGALAAARRADVVHGPAGIGPLLHPGVASVVTLLDVIWLLLPDQVAMAPADRERWRRTTRLSTARADRVIAISESGRDDIAGAYGIDPGRIAVTPLAAATPGDRPSPAAIEALRRRLEVGDAPVVLGVGQRQPYKGHAELVRALVHLPRAHVVLCGDPVGRDAELLALAGGLGVDGRVHLLGYVGEQELEALYALASCVALPSRMEGFGLPALEAMVRGVPVVCADVSALAEVGRDAALLVDPADPAAIAAAVGRVLQEPGLAHDLVARGRRRAQEHTWQRTAQATIAAYRAAAAA